MWPKLTQDNCYLLVLHSNPLGLMVRGLKKHESRPTKVGRSIVVLVSACADNNALPWNTDPTIEPNTIYCVGRVDRFDVGTYAKYDWVLDPLVVLPSPISLKGVGVGRRHVPPSEKARRSDEGSECPAVCDRDEQARGQEPAQHKIRRGVRH